MTEKKRGPVKTQTEIAHWHLQRFHETVNAQLADKIERELDDEVVHHLVNAKDRLNDIIHDLATTYRKIVRIKNATTNP